MQFVKPMPFVEALDKLGAQSPITAALSSSEWADLPVELRENAFFSANVESMRFLQNAQDSLTDFLAGNIKTLDDGQTLLATGSRAAFVDQMQKLLGSMGVQRTDGGLTDLTSERRLGLIFDIKTQQAGDYGYWRQGMDPDVLNEFPAQRFIRVKDVKEPRTSHEVYQDQVFLKTDPIWWRVINQDFGVPWGPWGWGCGHDVEDVDRDEAEKLGLIKRGQRLVAPKKFLNTNLQASAAGIEPELLEKMKRVFGRQISIEGDTIKWSQQSAVAANVEPTPAPAPPASATAVSSALNIRARGSLKEEIDAAVGAIDEVHDDGVLPPIPVRSTLKERILGYMQPVVTRLGITTDHIGVRADGHWPALTTVHEVGHFLDLCGIGPKGTYATDGGFKPMLDVLRAAEQTDTVKFLRAKLRETHDDREVLALQYYLKPREIWARAYAQFITERASSELLKAELQTSLQGQGINQLRQWPAADFALIADQIETMFQGLGWI